MENAMRSLFVTYCTAAAVSVATSFATPPAQAMTIATPAGLSAAIQQADVKQNVRCVCGRRAYYQPYAYTYAYRPYYAYAAYRPYTYTYAYTYRPYYAYAYRPYYAYAYRPYYAYAYRPYYTYAYRPYYAYAYAGYGRRHWIGWR
jgi:hypothetical protein